jgi:hypothetical protein
MHSFIGRGVCKCESHTQCTKAEIQLVYLLLGVLMLKCASWNVIFCNADELQLLYHSLHLRNDSRIRWSSFHRLKFLSNVRTPVVSTSSIPVLDRRRPCADLSLAGQCNLLRPTPSRNPFGRVQQNEFRTAKSCSYPRLLYTI